ncbi:hypothetical protein HDU67_006220 [Dinochytrium kinnereticum]|nr:hypothetical protein HDU67_006220 [Dinochytrium kinnereticum]
MAQKLLTPKAKALVQKLLDPKFTGTLGGGSVHPTLKPVHGTMSASQLKHHKAAVTRPATAPTATAITDQTKLLLDTKCAAGTAQTQALQFIVHFLGDISQPLHNCDRARGGNDVSLTYNGKGANFHAIHDTQIPVQRSKEVSATSTSAYANFLITTYESQKFQFTSKSFIDLTTLGPNNILTSSINMSNDANALTCSKSGFWTLYDQNPSQDFSGAYYQAVKIPIEIQLAKGGFRMAAWINAVAEACSPSTTPPPPPPTSSTAPPSPPVTSIAPPPSTCAHSVCVTGGPLRSGCSACATAVIRNDPYCGETGWDSTCVAEVREYCTGVVC